MPALLIVPEMVIRASDPTYDPPTSKVFPVNAGFEVVIILI
jgi:hypothetical protein